MAKDIEQLVQHSVTEADESARQLNQLAPNLLESHRLIAEVYEGSQQQDRSPNHAGDGSTGNGDSAECG